jgi:hypothetical protein
MHLTLAHLLCQYFFYLHRLKFYYSWQVDPLTCKPVYPYQYLKVNTIFEVAREANMRTAWCDKHPAYDILNGPSGLGIQDLFTPEINSDAPTVGSTTDWTKDNILTQQYDGYKVRLNIH